MGNLIKNGFISFVLDHMKDKINKDHNSEEPSVKGWRDNLKSRNGFRWLCWDFMIGLIACVAAFYLSPSNPDAMSLHFFFFCIVPFALSLSFFSKLCGVPLPCQGSGMGRYDLFASAGIAVMISSVVILLLIYIETAIPWGRYIMGTITLLAFVGMVVPRLLVASMVETRPLRMVIYGAGIKGQKLCSRIEGREGFDMAGNFEVVGFLDCDPERRGEKYCSHSVLGCLGSFDGDALRKLGIELVVLCCDAELEARNASGLFNLPLSGVEVLTKAAFIDQYYQEVSVSDSNPQCFASYRSLPGNAPIFAAKRVVDIAIAGAGLLLTFLLWPVLAVAIKLDGPGPVFFKQVRVGYQGRNFEILKFRTMCQDAEKEGAQWAVKDDPRVTRLGKFLRRSRLDELPQLINVLRGDMALVGPRPERPEFVSELAKEIPFYERRHMVLPGLTGWAQIRYRYGATKADALRKLQFDLYYIRHFTLGLDFQIMLKTIPMMMKGSR